MPVINFSLGVSAYLGEAAACGGDVVGLDWALPLDEAWERVGFERPVQGNLDPASLLGPWRELGSGSTTCSTAQAADQGTSSTWVTGLHAADAGGQRAAPRRARTGADVIVSVGVLVMAYGAPASLDEIPGYLADIRHGRPTPRAVLDEITENYRAIGGSSPLLAVTERQGALAAELERRVPVLPRDAPLGPMDRGRHRRHGRRRRHRA